MLERDVIKFLVPNSLDALRTTDLTDRSVIPVYLNPENLQFQDAKLINDTLTKGGYSIQYWGEKLTTITARGTTGSGGIEALNILRDIYRHEQLHFKKVLLARTREFEQEAVESLNDSSGINFGEGILSVLDTISNAELTGRPSQIFDGISSTIDAISNIFNNQDEPPQKVILYPTPAAFAVSIDMYFQGEKYRGYFSSFQHSETASSPGIVSYSFNFVITKKFGRRKNYMPWHRNPTDSTGSPISASLPLEGAKEEELTFPVSRPTTQSNITGTNNPFNVTNAASIDQSGIKEENDVGISRLSKIRS